MGALSLENSGSHAPTIFMNDTGRGLAAGGIRCLSRGNRIVSDERQLVSSVRIRWIMK